MTSLNKEMEQFDLQELNSKPRAASTSDIEGQPSTSTPIRHKTKIQFSIPGENTPLIAEPEKPVEIANSNKDKSNTEEMSLVPCQPIERQTSEEDEEILEVLRRVVRSCTDNDLSKRPTANEILEMLIQYLDDDNLE